MSNKAANTTKTEKPAAESVTNPGARAFENLSKYTSKAKHKDRLAAADDDEDEKQYICSCTACTCGHAVKYAGDICSSCSSVYHA